MLTAAAMLAYQVGGKATRDALFLSTHSVATLPAAVAGAAVVSVVVVLVVSRWMSAWGPARLVPAILFTSAGLLLAEWLVSARFAALAATMVYLHFNALGALLISGFWSVVGERFDPRTAKQHVGRIGAAGTLGGLAGGIIAERMGATVALTAMLPVLAVLHLAAAVMIRGISGGRTVSGRGEEPSNRMTLPEAPAAGIAVLIRSRYLRNLLGLVLLTTIAEGLLDFVFKVRAVDTYGRGGELMRVFAAFYTAVQVLTFLVQASLTRRALQSLGLARTVAALPATAGVAATGMLVSPAFAMTALARAAEAILHNSLYRSGYELLFTPLPRDEKRATKPLVDVGCARVGDALGAAVVQGALVLVPLAALSVLTVSSIVISAAAVLIALHLHQAYLRALEKSLLARAVQIELPDVEDSTTRTAFLSTMGVLGPADSVSSSQPPVPSQPARSATQRTAAIDPELRRIADLRSGDARRTRAALKGPLSRELIGYVIPLLAWDDVAGEALRVLREAVSGGVGQLVDALLDPEQEFAVRRRIPDVLSASDSPRAADGLIRALEDSRFEVRYRAGRALARLRERATLTLTEEAVFRAVVREANVGKAVWESQRLLDTAEEGSPFVDDFLRSRANRSLEHVFTLLSLVFPGQPLSIAFRGLQTDDLMLRGTALEYLESLLPAAVRERLWPLLEDRPASDRPARPRAEVLADLMRSHQSIALNLEKLRRQGLAGDPPKG
jgi:ATP:ADP antiporter, AAA family